MNDAPSTLGPADWLSLAAAPILAAMALLLAASDGGAHSAHPSSPSGMVLMYLLMSAFHSGSWLRLVSRRRRRDALSD